MNNQTNKRKRFHKLIRIYNEKWLQIKCHSVLGISAKIPSRIRWSEFHFKKKTIHSLKSNSQHCFTVEKRNSMYSIVIWWLMHSKMGTSQCPFFEFIRLKYSLNLNQNSIIFMRKFGHHTQHTHTQTNDNKWWWLWMDLANAEHKMAWAHCACAKYQMNIYYVETYASCLVCSFFGCCCFWCVCGSVQFCNSLNDSV